MCSVNPQEIGTFMMDCFNLTGKVALITGASSGLGAEFAHSLAYRGADVVILARRKEKLKATADDVRELGHKVLPIACDVTDKAAVKAPVDQAVAELGTIDILREDGRLDPATHL